MAEHIDLGNKGEALAAALLIKKGYVIRDKNWRYLKAEVDIIAQKGQTLAVIEVKTRSTYQFGNPQDFVNPKKIKLLVLAVDEYINSKNLDVEVRFDIIAIVYKNKGYSIEHLENAFYHFL